MRVVLEVEVPDCRHVRDALAPDDEQAPPGIGISSTCVGEVLRYVVEAPQEPRMVLRVKNTVDDLLRHVKAVLGLSRG